MSEIDAGMKPGGDVKSRVENPAPPLLALRAVTKTFGQFTALCEVDLQVRAGEIVGLLGENGAGKSTLLSIVSGNARPTAGVLEWRGEDIRFNSPRDAARLGIGVVHQHFQLVPEFTVAENIALQAPRSGFVFDEKVWRARISDWANQIGWRIDGARKIETLSVGERQRVEILKALFVHEGGSKNHLAAPLLLLDEPTANLTPGEVEELLGVLRRLREGGCGIVFVSHKLNEVLALCDRIAVLRRGRIVGEREVENTDTNELAQLMVGRSLSPPTSSQKEFAENAEACLEIKNLGGEILRDFSLQIRRGEIVGLAGVDGNGQRELLEILSGLRAAQSGNFQVIPHSSIETPESSIALVPADRQHVGLIPEFSLYENIALHPSMRADCKTRFGFDWRIAQNRTRELMGKFDVRAPRGDGSTPAAQLSGGNQQKLVVARALSFPHAIVIAADPTRGLDIAATQFVHEQLQNAAESGAGVLLVSSDLDEILALAHRIGVLYEGRLLPNENLLPRGTDRETIGALMGGLEVSR
jgi:simple sugar transport system ATP-binding protein